MTDPEGVALKGKVRWKVRQKHQETVDRIEAKIELCVIRRVFEVKYNQIDQLLARARLRVLQGIFKSRALRSEVLKVRSPDSF